MNEINHRLASLFNILGNGIRVEILTYLLDKNEAYLKQISDSFDKSNGTISRHLRKLADYDLIRSETRGRKKYFRIKRKELVEACLEIRNYLKRAEDTI